MALEFTDKVREKIHAEIQNVERALANLRLAVERHDKSVIEFAAEGTFLHNVYNGIENILVQILKSQKVTVTKTLNWHKDILETVSDRGIIDREMADELYEYLAFRHFFVHAYGFMLEESRLEPLAENITDVWSRFLSQIGF